MRRVLFFVFLAIMALTVCMACSQQSGSEEQAKSQPQEEAVQEAMAPAQAPAAEEAAPQMQDAAAEPQAQQAQPMGAQDQMADQETQMGASADSAGAPAQEPMAASEPESSQPREISGTVVRTDDGIAIFSDSGSYVVAGQDMKDLVGQNVKVTGTVAEGDEKPVITVISVVVVK